MVVRMNFLIGRNLGRNLAIEGEAHRQVAGLLCCRGRMDVKEKQRCMSTEQGTGLE